MVQETDPMRAARILRAETRNRWTTKPFGPDGWVFVEQVESPRRQIILTAGELGPHSVETWLHASIAYDDEEVMPSYDDLALLHRAAWGDDGWSYQVFAPVKDHVNIRANALHLWGRTNGAPLLPNFGAYGTI